MKFIRRFLSTAFILFFASHTASALDKNDIFTPTEAAAALRGEIITDVRLNDSSISTLPDRTDTHWKAASMVLKNPAEGYNLLASERAFIPLSKKKIPLLKKILESESMLSGMKYYSIKREKVMPFINDSKLLSSWNTENTNSRNKNTPEIKGAVIRINDNRFGSIDFASTLAIYPGCIILDNTNVNPLTKYNFNICSPGDYRTVSIFIFSPRDGGVFYYSLHAMKIRNAGILKFLPVQLSSFGNRLRASLVHLASLLGLDWQNKIAAFTSEI